MTISSRRRALSFGISGLALGAATRALAQSSPGGVVAFPSRPIRIVVPFSAGGATDILARLIGDKLSQRVGQPVIVDNKAGASGIIGTDFVAKAPADGHTIVLGTSNSLLSNEFLFRKLPYKVDRDMALVTQIATAPLLLIVHPMVPVKNAQEFVGYIRKNKGKLSYGSYGIGAYPHVVGAYMSDTYQAQMQHVPYKGEAPMIADLVGAQIHMAFATAMQAKPFLESGKLQAIGVSGEKRIGALPDVPTLFEQGLKDEPYRMTGWLALAAPGKTPRAIVNRLAQEVNSACEEPDVKAKIAGMGLELKASAPDEFAAQYRREAPVWARLIKQSGAKVE